MKNKLKSYSFWMSVTAGVILVLNNIGKVCGFSVESDAVTAIVDSICGVLILFGVLTMPKSKAKGEKEGDECGIEHEIFESESVEEEKTESSKTTKSTQKKSQQEVEKPQDK